MGLSEKKEEGYINKWDVNVNAVVNVPCNWWEGTLNIASMKLQVTFRIAHSKNYLDSDGGCSNLDAFFHLWFYTKK